MAGQILFLNCECSRQMEGTLRRSYGLQAKGLLLSVLSSKNRTSEDLKIGGRSAKEVETEEIGHRKNRADGPDHRTITPSYHAIFKPPSMRVIRFAG